MALPHYNFGHNSCLKTDWAAYLDSFFWAMMGVLQMWRLSEIVGSQILLPSKQSCHAFSLGAIRHVYRKLTRLAKCLTCWEGKELWSDLVDCAVFEIKIPIPTCRFLQHNTFFFFFFRVPMGLRLNAANLQRVINLRAFDLIYRNKLSTEITVCYC